MQGEKENISAFVSECYDKYHTAIYKFCLVRLGEMNEHADDCVQEVFLVFQNKLLEGIEILNPRAYLYKIADNIVKDTIKKSAKHRRRNVPLESAEHTESPPLIPDGFDYDKCAELIVSLLSDEEQYNAALGITSARSGIQNSDKTGSPVNVSVNFTVNNGGRDLTEADVTAYSRRIANEINILLGNAI